jgi:S-DNA-T family DNA segregation ATPase FtsK/SpoIIIE
MNNAKKTDPMEPAAAALIHGAGKMLRMLWYGIKRLRRIPCLAGLGACMSISFLCYRNPWIYGYIGHPYISFAAKLFTFLLPALYLIALGAWELQRADRFYRIFKEIEFMGKDKRYPRLIAHKEDGVKDIYTFRSNIPFDVWENSIPYLQTAFDCNILRIEQPGSKKDVQLITIDAKVKIPDRLLWEDRHLVSDDGVIVIGENMMGPLNFDLNKVPHVLAAGTTGSGKSVALRMMLWQLAMKGTVIFMLDFKGGVEFGIRYEEFGEVVIEREKAVEILELLVKENTLRLELFRRMDVKNLKEFNKKTGYSLSRIGVFCDEIGEMLDKKGAGKEDKEVIGQLEGSLSTLARLSRATGINLFLGTQRPDANILTGQIKNNLPVRICGRFADKPASEIVLGNTLATKLPDKGGRLLFQAGADTLQFQGYYFDDDMMNFDKIPQEDHQVMLPELARRSGAEALSIQRRPKAPAKAARTLSGNNPKPRRPTDQLPGETELNFDYENVVI